MDLSVTNNLYDAAALRTARYVHAAENRNAQPPQNDNLPAVIETTPKGKSTGTRLLNETREDLLNGAYRLTRTFEKDDGRKFTKVEEFTFTDQGSRKTVVQQNPSGSISVYEEILDREDGGNFRRTQRFQDGSGDVATTITQDYTVTDPFILTGGESTPTSYTPSSPFEPIRGTQLDLRA